MKNAEAKRSGSVSIVLVMKKYFQITVNANAFKSNGHSLICTMFVLFSVYFCFSSWWYLQVERTASLVGHNFLSSPSKYPETEQRVA